VIFKKKIVTEEKGKKAFCVYFISKLNGFWMELYCQSYACVLY
jgi:hypothetical protein